jgi:hypothetical protein
MVLLLSLLSFEFEQFLSSPTSIDWSPSLLSLAKFVLWLSECKIYIARFYCFVFSLKHSLQRGMYISDPPIISLIEPEQVLKV